MFAPNAFTIRLADEHDADALRRLAELDGRPPLDGRILIAEDHGAPVAAFAIEDGRTVVAPSRRTGIALVLLRIRANVLTSYERTPSLAERVRAAIRVAPASMAPR